MTLYAGNSLTGAIYKGDQLICSSSGGGGGGSGTRDVELTRISDDSGNEIGTWYMNFVNGSNNEYKVIVLDAQYRIGSKQWCSQRVTVTNMPLYSNNVTAWWYNSAYETATENTQKILDFCAVNNYTSTACSHCRSQSFVIDGVIYYGQLPNMRELFDMWRHRADIESMDTSASSHSSTNFSSARSIWASTQFSSYNGWTIYSDGIINANVSKAAQLMACPVLEIPA